MQKMTIILLFLVVSITWGTTFMAIKIAADTIPPLFITGMRFLLASPLLICICYYTNTSLLFPSGKKIFQLVICIFYFSIPFSLMLYGGTYVNSIIASVIFSNMPIIILLLSFLIFNKPLNIIQYIGLTLAISALLIILFKEIQLGNKNIIKGIIALILAMISHAMVYLHSKEKYSNISILTFNALPSLFSGTLLLFISNIVERPIFNNFSKTSIIAILYLSYFSGVFGILSYFYLQKKVSSFYASIVFFIFPLITLILEKVIYGYSITSEQFQLIMFSMSSIFLTLIPFDYFKLKNFIQQLVKKFRILL
ncbi:DMT family transporter [Buchnera aphidicola]|uniref:DMT family transporter n=1 Tax=Buchnera aphidicola subsp. Melaphis rhois TaxID=118103 RepID=A0A4D6Y2H9_BUCMH|nr:DMT family transporter [Buchnera aphidicola]QCI23287.1 DMT family transporter [Buchnera aphidicola (Melaphis rhois)]